jgi:hypothetical protein
MPKQSIQQFAAGVKAKFPEYADMDDRDLTTQVVNKFPEYKDWVDLSPEPTLGDSLITGGLRTGGAILGGFAGSMAAPGIGTVAGGALGAGIGEGLAELYEKANRLRSEVNPAQIAVQAGLGAIPVKGIGAGASILKSAALHGAQGAGMGAVATTATELAETGNLPSLGQVATGAGGGALIGGTIGAFGARPKTARPATSVPEFDALQGARDAEHTTTLADKMRALPTHLREDYVDRTDPVKQDTARLVERINASRVARGLPPGKLKPSANPHDVIALEYGGGGGRADAQMREYDALIKEAQTLGILPDLENYVQVKGFQHVDRELKAKAQRLLAADPNDKEGLEILRKIQAKEHLPEIPGVGSVLDDQKLGQIEQTLRGHQQFADIDRLAKEVFKRQRDTLQLGMQEGIISNQVGQELLARGDDYIPTPRIQETAEGGRNITTTALDLPQQHVLKGRLGSSKVNVNVLQAAAERDVAMLKEVARNRMGRTQADLRKLDPIAASHIVELKGGQTPRPGYGTVSFYDDGAKRTFEVPKDVADVYDGIFGAAESRLVGGAVLRAVHAVSQRFMTAVNPGFALVNAIGDIQDARKNFPFMERFDGVKPSTWISGPKDFAKFTKEWAGAFVSALRKDPDFARFQKAGGDFSTIQHEISPQHFDGTAKGTFEDATLGRLARFSAATENATKLASFNRAIKARKSDSEAALLARRLGGSPDFAVKGRKGAEANMLFMFFNAQVQGAARNVRHFGGSPVKLASAVASATVPLMALHTYNNQFVDPDGTRALDRVSDQDKQANWIIVLPATYTTAEGTVRHMYWKVKKGHLNRLIHNPIEQAINSAFKTATGEREASDVKGQAKELTQVAFDAASNVLPGSLNLKVDDVTGSLVRWPVSSLNPAYKVPLEWAMNKDTFRDIPIEAKRLQGVQVSERKTSTTSPTMAKVSKLLEQTGIGGPIGASPQKLQHAFASVVPGLGESALGALDLATGKPSTVPLEGDEALSRMPIAGPILRRFVGNSKDQVENTQLSRFYDIHAASDEAIKTFKLLQSRSPEEARAMAADPEQKMLIKLNPKLVEMAQQLAKFRKQKEHMAANPPPDHAAQLRKIGQAETALITRLDAQLATLLPQK